MNGIRPLLGFIVLAVMAGALACGGGGHTLTSVAISPATADAKSYPNGLVPFTATGTFSSPPSPAQLNNGEIQWCYGGLANVANPVAGQCAGNIAQFASVDQNGVAQCNASFQGTVNILAGVPEPPVLPDGGNGLKVYGAAQLTCP